MHYLIRESKHKPKVTVTMSSFSQQTLPRLGDTGHAGATETSWVPSTGVLGSNETSSHGDRPEPVMEELRVRGVGAGIGKPRGSGNPGEVPAPAGTWVVPGGSLDKAKDGE